MTFSWLLSSFLAPFLLSSFLAPTSTSIPRNKDFPNFGYFSALFLLCSHTLRSHGFCFVFSCLSLYSVGFSLFKMFLFEYSRHKCYICLEIQHNDSTSLDMFFTLCSLQLDFLTIQWDYSITDCILYVVPFIPMTCSFPNWKPVSYSPFLYLPLSLCPPVPLAKYRACSLYL